MRSQARNEAGQPAFGRRDILAAAGAAVAGMIARQTARPVIADSGTWTMPYDSGMQNSGSALIALTNNGNGTGVSVNSNNTGMLSSSTNGYGLLAVTSAVQNSGIAAVKGDGNGTGTSGVFGFNFGGGIGVLGENSGAGIGVYGAAVSGTGVYGLTNASNQYGVLGQSFTANSTAIAGTCTGNGSSAFSGGTTNPNAYAAVFQGTVVVQGNFAVTDTKSAVVQHPRTGDHRLVYCVESPEAWFEDFGEGILAGGKASVTLDPDFAALIHADSYHVFLTSHDPASAGLAVASRTATGFVVEEHSGGTSGGTFSWRVVAKRKDVKGERLGTFTMPNLPLPKPIAAPPPVTPRARPPKP